MACGEQLPPQDLLNLSIVSAPACGSLPCASARIFYDSGSRHCRGLPPTTGSTELSGEVGVCPPRGWP
eukprot:2846117-Pyramimonas_sp.AAC.1